MGKGSLVSSIVTPDDKEAREYVDRLEKLINCQVDIISTGPHRDQTIMPESVI